MNCQNCQRAMTQDVVNASLYRCTYCGYVQMLVTGQSTINGGPIPVTCNTGGDY